MRRNYAILRRIYVKSAQFMRNYAQNLRKGVKSEKSIIC